MAGSFCMDGCCEAGDCTVEVTVLCDGVAVSGATVEIYEEGTTTLVDSGTTNGSGVVSLTVPCGDSYDFEITATGKDPMEGTLGPVTGTYEVTADLCTRVLEEPGGSVVYPGPTCCTDGVPWPLTVEVDLANPTSGSCAFYGSNANTTKTLTWDGSIGWYVWQGAGDGEDELRCPPLGDLSTATRILWSPCRKPYDPDCDAFDDWDGHFFYENTSLDPPDCTWIVNVAGFNGGDSGLGGCPTGFEAGGTWSSEIKTTPGGSVLATVHNA